MKKSIYSEGGPFIALPLNALHMWGGTDKWSFSGSPPNDYEAACSQVNDTHGVPRSAALLRGSMIDGLIIPMPIETSTLRLDEDDVYIAQVHYCDDLYDFNCVKKEWFGRLAKPHTFHFRSQSGDYILFDAAYQPGSIGDDALTFHLRSGQHVVTAGLMEPDDHTLLTLVRIARAPKDDPGNQ